MNYQRNRRAYPIPARQAVREEGQGQEEAPVFERCLSGMSSPAMVYPACQRFEALSEPGAALKSGSLFRSLVMPFAPTGGKGRCGV